MNPCARCKRTVYPVEKFNCLDKIWHKACFTCETCNLKLTMKTYKGYNKLPYCQSHYPTTRFTAVADTPEALRLAKQQRNQSEVEYKKDKVESMKGFTQVADTVSNRQASQAGRLASGIGYHQQPPQQVSHDYGGGYAPEPVSPVQVPPPQQNIPSPTQPQPQAPAPASSKPQYVALYEYAAADDDEISFHEGDIIVDVATIDEGWMEGRNTVSGQYGMFPSNYVQPA